MCIDMLKPRTIIGGCEKVHPWMLKMGCKLAYERALDD